MTTTPRLWNSLTQVNTTDGDQNQFESQIAPLQDGGYVVVWTDLSHTYNPLGEAVVGQRYDAAGNKVGGEVKLSQFTNGDQFSPAITTLANGDVAVAFVDLFTGNNNIYVRVFDPSLNFVREDDIDLGSNQTFHPSLTALAGGSYAVSYTLTVGTNTFIEGRIVSATGGVGTASPMSPPICSSTRQRHRTRTRMSWRWPTAASWSPGKISLTSPPMGSGSMRTATRSASSSRFRAARRLNISTAPC
jgi:hypothetical protein